MEIVQKVLSGSISSLITDGWRDVNEISFINYIAVSRKKMYFLESFSTGDSRHDASNLAADHQQLPRGTSSADNTAANKGTPSAQTTEDVLSWVRVSHAAPSRPGFRRLVPWLDTLQSEYKGIVRFIKNNYALWRKVKGLQKALMPCDKRWGWLHGYFKTALAAEASLFAIVPRCGFLEAKTNKQSKLGVRFRPRYNGRLCSTDDKAVDLLKATCNTLRRSRLSSRMCTTCF
jgi:hypothetical protein